MLLFSSATTGLAKGVQLSHNNLTVHSEQSKVNFPCEPMLQQAKDDFQETLLSVLPFFHYFGLTTSLLSKMAVGVKNVSLPGFQPDIFVNAMKEYKPSVLPLVPSIGKKPQFLNPIQTAQICFSSFIVSFLTSYNDIDAKVLESVKYVISGSAPIGALDVERLRQK